MSSSKLNNSEISFKDYAKALDLQNISPYVKTMAPLANLSLKNIVQVYEILESEMFNFHKNLFNDKYKQNLDKHRKLSSKNLLKNVMVLNYLLKWKFIVL